MESLLDEITGNGLRILLLGSYDGETKGILYRLRRDLNEKFQRYASITLLIEAADVYVALAEGLHDYTILFERKEHGGTALIFQGSKLLEAIEYVNEKDFQRRIGRMSSNTIDFKKFRKLKQLEKVSLLADWADLIYVVRQFEATRGGEFVELVYLLLPRVGISAQDPFKFEFFYKNGIEISTMIQEIISNYKIDATSYNHYNDLRKLIFGKTANHISRLNMLGRFREFE